MPAKVAYLVNQYPMVSHSFIRREILALEDLGLPIERYSIRSCAAELVDEADRQELAKTRFILAVGAVGLLLGLLKVIATRPLRFLQALRLAITVGWRSSRGVLYHIIYLAEACVLLGWITDSHASHLHAHFGTNSTTVAMLCEALGGPPYSFTVHGPEEFDQAAAIALPTKIRRAAFVVAISSFAKSQLYRWCDYDHWPKIHVVRCGVDQTFLGQNPVPIPSKAQLVCVGRLCEQKGQLLLMEAVKQLAAEGHRFKLVLVGDGESREAIEALRSRYQLDDYVDITGWATGAEVRQQLLSARAMVLPSFAEGLPVVIMEALACCRPVITTYVAGIPELVKPECGWLVTPGNVASLTAAMRTALQRPSEQLAAMGASGMRRVAQQHSAMTEAETLIKLFSTVSLEAVQHASLETTNQKL